MTSRKSPIPPNIAEDGKPLNLFRFSHELITDAVASSKKVPAKPSILRVVIKATRKVTKRMSLAPHIVAANGQPNASTDCLASNASYNLSFDTLPPPSLHETTYSLSRAPSHSSDLPSIYPLPPPPVPPLVVPGVSTTISSHNSIDTAVDLLYVDEPTLKHHLPSRNIDNHAGKLSDRIATQISPPLVKGQTTIHTSSLNITPTLPPSSTGNASSSVPKSCVHSMTAAPQCMDPTLLTSTTQHTQSSSSTQHVSYISTAGHHITGSIAAHHSSTTCSVGDHPVSVCKCDTDEPCVILTTDTSGGVSPAPSLVTSMSTVDHRYAPSQDSNRCAHATRVEPRLPSFPNDTHNTHIQQNSTPPTRGYASSPIDVDTADTAFLGSGGAFLRSDTAFIADNPASLGNDSAQTYLQRADSFLASMGHVGHGLGMNAGYACHDLGAGISNLRQGVDANVIATTSTTNATMSDITVNPSQANTSATITFTTSSTTADTPTTIAAAATITSKASDSSLHSSMSASVASACAPSGISLPRVSSRSNISGQHQPLPSCVGAQSLSQAHTSSGSKPRILSTCTVSNLRLSVAAASQPSAPITATPPTTSQRCATAAVGIPPPASIAVITSTTAATAMLPSTSTKLAALSSPIASVLASPTPTSSSATTMTLSSSVNATVPLTVHPATTTAASTLPACIATTPRAASIFLKDVTPPSVATPLSANITAGSAISVSLSTPLPTPAAGGMTTLAAALTGVVPSLLRTSAPISTSITTPAPTTVVTSGPSISTSTSTSRMTTLTATTPTASIAAAESVTTGSASSTCAAADKAVPTSVTESGPSGVCVPGSSGLTVPASSPTDVVACASTSCVLALPPAVQQPQQHPQPLLPLQSLQHQRQHHQYQQQVQNHPHQQSQSHLPGLSPLCPPLLPNCTPLPTPSPSPSHTLPPPLAFPIPAASPMSNSSNIFVVSPLTPIPPANALPASLPHQSQHTPQTHGHLSVHAHTRGYTHGHTASNGQMPGQGGGYANGYGYGYTPIRGMAQQWQQFQPSSSPSHKHAQLPIQPPSQLPASIQAPMHAQSQVQLHTSIPLPSSRAAQIHPRTHSQTHAQLQAQAYTYASAHSHPHSQAHAHVPTNAYAQAPMHVLLSHPVATASTSTNTISTATSMPHLLANATSLLPPIPATASPALSSMPPNSTTTLPPPPINSATPRAPISASATAIAPSASSTTFLPPIPPSANANINTTALSPPSASVTVLPPTSINTTVLPPVPTSSTSRSTSTVTSTSSAFTPAASFALGYGGMTYPDPVYGYQPYPYLYPNSFPHPFPSAFGGLGAAQHFFAFPYQHQPQHHQYPHPYPQPFPAPHVYPYPYPFSPEAIFFLLASAAASAPAATVPAVEVRAEIVVSYEEDLAQFCVRALCRKMRVHKGKIRGGAQGSAGGGGAGNVRVHVEDGDADARRGIVDGSGGVSGTALTLLHDDDEGTQNTTTTTATTDTINPGTAATTTTDVDVVADSTRSVALISAVNDAEARSAATCAAGVGSVNPNIARVRHLSVVSNENVNSCTSTPVKKGGGVVTSVNAMNDVICEHVHGVAYSEASVSGSENARLNKDTSGEVFGRVDRAVEAAEADREALKDGGTWDEDVKDACMANDLGMDMAMGDTYTGVSTGVHVDVGPSMEGNTPYVTLKRGKIAGIPCSLSGNSSGSFSGFESAHSSSRLLFSTTTPATTSNTTNNNISTLMPTCPSALSATDTTVINTATSATSSTILSPVSVSRSVSASLRPASSSHSLSSSFSSVSSYTSTVANVHATHVQRDQYHHSVDNTAFSTTHAGSSIHNQADQSIDIEQQPTTENLPEKRDQIQDKQEEADDESEEEVVYFVYCALVKRSAEAPQSSRRNRRRLCTEAVLQHVATLWDPVPPPVDALPPTRTCTPTSAHSAEHAPEPADVPAGQIMSADMASPTPSSASLPMPLTASASPSVSMSTPSPACEELAEMTDMIAARPTNSLAPNSTSTSSTNPAVAAVPSGSLVSGANTTVESVLSSLATPLSTLAASPASASYDFVSSPSGAYASPSHTSAAAVVSCASTSPSLSTILSNTAPTADATGIPILTTTTATAAIMNPVHEASPATAFVSQAVHLPPTSAATIVAGSMDREMMCGGVSVDVGADVGVHKDGNVRGNVCERELLQKDICMSDAASVVCSNVNPNTTNPLELPPLSAVSLPSSCTSLPSSLPSSFPASLTSTHSISRPSPVDSPQSIPLPPAPTVLLLSASGEKVDLRGTFGSDPHEKVQRGAQVYLWLCAGKRYSLLVEVPSMDGGQEEVESACGREVDGGVGVGAGVGYGNRLDGADISAVTYPNHNHQASSHHSAYTTTSNPGTPGTAGIEVVATPWSYTVTDVCVCGKEKEKGEFASVVRAGHERAGLAMMWMDTALQMQTEEGKEAEAENRGGSSGGDEHDLFTDGRKRRREEAGDGGDDHHDMRGSDAGGSGGNHSGSRHAAVGTAAGVGMYSAVPMAVAGSMGGEVAIMVDDDTYDITTPTHATHSHATQTTMPPNSSPPGHQPHYPYASNNAPPLSFLTPRQQPHTLSTSSSSLSSSSSSALHADQQARPRRRRPTLHDTRLPAPWIGVIPHWFQAEYNERHDGSRRHRDVQGNGGSHGHNTTQAHGMRHVSEAGAGAGAAHAHSTHLHGGARSMAPVLSPGVSNTHGMTIASAQGIVNMRDGLTRNSVSAHNAMITSSAMLTQGMGQPQSIALGQSMAHAHAHGLMQAYGGTQLPTCALTPACAPVQSYPHYESTLPSTHAVTPPLSQPQASGHLHVQMETQAHMQGQGLDQSQLNTSMDARSSPGDVFAAAHSIHPEGTDIPRVSPNTHSHSYSQAHAHVHAQAPTHLYIVSNGSIPAAATDTPSLLHITNATGTPGDVLHQAVTECTAQSTEDNVSEGHTSGPTSACHLASFSNSTTISHATLLVSISRPASGSL